MNNKEFEKLNEWYKLGLEYRKIADKKSLWFLRGILLFCIGLILFYPPITLFTPCFTKILFISILLCSSLPQLLDYMSDRIFSFKLESTSNGDTIKSIKIINFITQFFVYTLYIIIHLFLILIILIKF